MDGGVDSAPVVVEPPPPGLIAAVVGLGHGGRTAVSCDGGRTFRINSFYGQPAGDHSPYAAIGLAGGKAGFVAALGWGAPGRLIHSANGVDWTELPGSSYTWADGSTGSRGENTSGAFYDGRYKVFWSQTLLESEDGRKWTGTNYRPPRVSHIRETEYDARTGVLLMRVERDEGGRNYLAMISTDGGKSYKELAPRSTGCAQFEWGPVAQSHGVMLAGGTAGTLCRSEDRGMTWATVPNQGGVQALFSDDTGFFLLRGTQVFRSDDGKSWSSVFNAGVGLANGVYSPHVGYVIGGESGGKMSFFRSDDGRNWTRATVGAGPSFGIRRMRTGFVTPSASCPAR